MKQLLLILSILAILSCQNNDQTKLESTEYPYIVDFSEVEYTQEPQCISEFSDTIEYIRLSDDILLPDPCELSIVLDNDNNIYIEHDRIEKFNPTGEYIKSLYNIGQGPKEISNKLLPAAYGFDENIVYIDDFGKEEYSKFTLNGDYLGKVKRKDSIGHYRTYIAILNKRAIYYYQGDLNFFYLRHKFNGMDFNPDGKYLFFSNNLLTDSVEYRHENKNYKIKANGHSNSITFSHGWPILYGYIDSNVWLRHSHHYTIYRSTNAINFTPWYEIIPHSQMGDYKFMINEQIDAITRTELNSKHYLEGIIATDVGIFFSYSVGLWNKYGIGFCHKNEKAKSYSDKPFKNDLDEYLPQLDFSYSLFNTNKSFQKNGYLYLLVEAYKFFEDGAKPPFTDLTEDSNPIVVKIKLKCKD